MNNQSKHNPANIYEVKEIRSKSTVYLGVGAIQKIFDITKELKERNITKVIVVTGKNSYQKSGAWEPTQKALEQNGIEYTIYDGITPNPTVDQVDEATAVAKKMNAQAVLTIGGGSPIDAAKSVAILMRYPEKNARNLYQYEFTPNNAAPLISINLTHGTGTEIDRFAVVSIPEKQYKPAIAYDCIYPLYSIDDPALMTMLPADQTAFVSVDAINHVVEAATSKAASLYSILLAKETVRLVGHYLPIALQEPGNLEARYHLLYASMIAGISFDNGLLHFTHALEHPLSAVKPELAHGLGLAMLLPAVVEQIYSSSSRVLAEVLSPLVAGLTGSPNEGEKASQGLKRWLKSIGIPSTLKDEGFSEKDVDNLTNLALSTPSLSLLLSLAPTASDRAVVSRLYQSSL